MQEINLNDLFLQTLKDVYYAEKQILKALPKMARSAQSAELRQAFEKHLQETEGQVERLEEVFGQLGKRTAGVRCEAIDGLSRKDKEVMERFADTEALDAGLVAAAQAVEHYEMARYGALKCWADELDMKEAADLLDQTLQEEKQADQSLPKLATSKINAQAAAA